MTISDDLVRTVALICPPAALASGTVTASPLRVTLAVEPEGPGSSRSRVVARLGNGGDEAVVVTLSACPPVSFLVDDATGRTVSGRAPSVCTDPLSYLLHPGASHEIGSAAWPLPGSHTLPTATYAVRAVLEEWSCAGGGTLPTTASAPVAVLIEGARVRRATE